MGKLDTQKFKFKKLMDKIHSLTFTKLVEELMRSSDLDCVGFYESQKYNEMGITVYTYNDLLKKEILDRYSQVNDKLKQHEKTNF